MRQYHLHLISDSTGETVSTVARAAAVQFKDAEAIEHSWALVRNKSQIDKVLDAIEAHPGLVLYTLVEAALEERLREGCRAIQVPCVPVLEHINTALSSYLGQSIDRRPGRQHQLDEDYYGRIEAMQFTLEHDDGQGLHSIGQADVILIGVSRTSKTPTCMYLANRGVKAANVPLVPNIPIPQQVLDGVSGLVIGLTASPDRLSQIRRNRLRTLDEAPAGDYADLEAVRGEMREARQLFEAHKWPVIDVTRRSIEETAAAVLGLYRKHVGAE